MRSFVRSALVLSVTIVAVPAAAQPLENKSPLGPSAAANGASSEDGVTTPTELVNVRVRSLKVARFEVREERSWRLLCQAPCAVEVPVGSEVRIIANGRESNRLLLSRAGLTDIDVDIDEGSTSQRTVGYVTTIIGGMGLVPAAAVPLLVLVTALFPALEKAKAGGLYSDPVVFGPAIAGAALVPLGIALIMTAKTGSVTVRSLEVTTQRARPRGVARPSIGRVGLRPRQTPSN